MVVTGLAGSYFKNNLTFMVMDCILTYFGKLPWIFFANTFATHADGYLILLKITLARYNLQCAANEKPKIVQVLLLF